MRRPLACWTVNALTAADKVIMPLECEFFALRGLALLNDTIGKVQDRLNLELEILGILGTMYDARTLHSREVLERVAFGDKVFHTVIRRTIKFLKTTVAGEPITTYASSSPGAEAYRMLARGAATMPRRVALLGAKELLRPTEPANGNAAVRTGRVQRREDHRVRQCRTSWSPSNRPGSPCVPGTASPSTAAA